MVLDHRARNLPRLLGTILLVFAVQFVVLSWYFGVKFEDIHGQIFQTSTSDSDDDTSIDTHAPHNGNTEQSFRRAIVVYFPHDKQDALLPPFLGLRASWLDLYVHEPSKWRTDLVVYTTAAATHPNAPASPLLSILDSLGCKTTRRRSNDEPNRCVVVPSYEPISSKDSSVDSMHIAAMPRMNAYHWILRTDVHALVTPAFATWKPSAMTVSRGTYPSGSRDVLARVALERLHIAAVPHAQVGATWYGPTKLVQTCAAQAVDLMQKVVLPHPDLQQHAASSHEGGAALRLFGSHLALNNCTKGFAIDVRDDMLEFPASSTDSTANHAHVAVMAGAAAAADAGGLRKDVVHEYAQFMAVEGSKALANATVAASSPSATSASPTTTLKATTSAPTTSLVATTTAPTTTIHATTTLLPATTATPSATPPSDAASFVRAAVVFIPQGPEGGRFVQQLRWFRRSWQHMALTEPAAWRTDIVIFIDGPVPELAAMNCSESNVRTTRDAPNACVVVSSYKRLKSASFDYAFGDSINVVAVTDIPAMALYDWMLRTDIDTFLTPAFSTWKPEVMTVGRGGYSFSETNAARLARISRDLDLHDAKLNNIGSTWYGPATLVRECAKLTVRMMQHLHEKEFTAEEKSDAYGIKGWPEWHYGVLTLYAGHIAINHCTKDAGVVKDDVNLDFATTSSESTTLHAHLHTWQNDVRFSKFVFLNGGYASENKSALDITRVADYAMFMALDSLPAKETSPPPAAAPAVPTLTDESFVRAAVVFIPRKTREDVFVKQFRWFRRSWLEMHKTEPPNFRTDLVVVSDGIIKDLRGLGCSTKPRESRDAPNRCILVQDYTVLYSKDTFDYRFGDSINIVAKATPVLDAYDWLLRTDIDVFLTPAFSAWHPTKMIVGGGGYQTATNIHRLDRIARDLNLNVAGMNSVGSTWYGPTKLIVECANLTVFMMKYLHENEFTAEEKSPEYGTKGWPEWHYGVLTLYAGHVAINHCSFGNLAEKDENMLDFPTASDNDLAHHAHLHTWQNRGRFSKFVFDDGGYANEKLADLNLNKVSDYAMYMALDSQETPEPTLVPVSYAPDTPQGQELVRAIVVVLPTSDDNDAAAVSHFRSLHQSWKDMLRSEPALWRTDLVVLTARLSMPELETLGCTSMYRTTSSYKSFCVQVSSTSQATLTKLVVDGDSSTSWDGYDLANALHAIQLDLPQLKSYQWILRSDLASLVTPGLSTWQPATPVFGPAIPDDSPPALDQVHKLATELNLDHLALVNAGTTWYGPSKWVVECAKTGLAALLHLHKTNETAASWTGKSAAALAATVAINHCANKHLDGGVSAVLNDVMLDVPTTSAASPSDHAHLRAVMDQNPIKFSAAAFAAGTYADVDLESLHPTDTIHDYAMAMALKSHGGLTPTSLPPAGARRATESDGSSPPGRPARLRVR